MSEIPPNKETKPTRDLIVRSNAKAFHGTIGIWVDPEATGNGHSEATCKLARRHLNLSGMVHGGVYATILDTAMGWSVKTTLNEWETTATTGLYIDFIRPAKAGMMLNARGNVIRRGRHVAFVEGKITDQDGNLLATGSGTWYILEIPPKRD
jgi:uncharacterized protein (TIGR00369 family)